MLAGGLGQYASFLSQGPASQYREYYSHSRSPDMSIYVADAQFNLSSRSVVYRLQIQILTNQSQGYGLDFNFANTLTGGYRVFLNSTQLGSTVSYAANQVGIVDKLEGLSELYPYDTYRVEYDVSTWTRSPFDFSQNFVPYAYAYMKYPESLNWEIQVSASKIAQYPWQSGFVLSFQLTLTILRIPGYTSLISLVPMWTANVVLGSTLFLLDKRARRNLPATTERLTVYISLFVFIPTFLFLVASQLPLKLLPSIAELFLVALLSSTASFAVFTNLSKYTHKTWDGHAVVFSILSLCLFMCIDPLYYMLYELRVDPRYGLNFNTFTEVAQWFSDPRVFPWIILISMVYFVPYLKAQRNFTGARASIFLSGALVFWLTSFERFHDPTLAFISAGYMLFAVWRSVAGKRVTLREMISNGVRRIKSIAGNRI
jgi:hypothetical protein